MTAKRPKVGQQYFYFAPHRGNQPNEDRREVVRMLYQSGLSCRQVAEQIGVTFQAVHSMLNRMGLKPRPRGGNYGSHSRHKK